MLLFDEFDDPYQQVDRPAVLFLNLRAIQDRHNGQLIFVTASGARPCLTRMATTSLPKFSAIAPGTCLAIDPLRYGTCRCGVI